MAFIFRADNTNVGDWYCPPFKYFPFKPQRVFDILDSSINLDSEKIVIVGGGGLGNEFFRSHLNKLSETDRKYKLIAWGVGVDSLVNTDGRVLPTEINEDILYSDYFSRFDEVGIRVWSENQKHKYVPCASCMSPLFFKYREVKPTKRIGVYSHKRVPININGLESDHLGDNSGNNIEDKLRFLSQFEYIITNTYHGVYWATLLNRKVLCIPFKSGLFSFKDKPVYVSSGQINENHFVNAINYPNSLEENRWLNIKYYEYLINRYGDI